MTLIRSLNEICWIVFVVVWLVGALCNAIKTPAKRQLPSTGGWVIRLFLLAMILVIVHRPDLSHGPIQSFLLWHFSVAGLPFAGAFILVASTLFTLWARFTLGMMWDSQIQIKPGHHLVTSGPYRISRNPIYTGIWGMGLGSLLSLQRGWLFLAMIAATFYFFQRIRKEEGLLIDAFGDEYAEYKRRVPPLIPWTRRPRH